MEAHLRLRERGRRRGERWPPSSSATLSELRKCLDRKQSSSGVGWKGSWWRRSREDELDWQEGVSGPWVHGQHHSQDPALPSLSRPSLFVTMVTSLPLSCASFKTPASMSLPPGSPHCSLGNSKTPSDQTFPDHTRIQIPVYTQPGALRAKAGSFQGPPHCSKWSTEWGSQDVSLTRQLFNTLK